METTVAHKLASQQNLLALSLLGPFQTTLGHEPVTLLRTRKEQALLAYLAVEADRSHQREALAELFWPERPEGVARASLRQALSGVRRAIGGEYLLTTRDTVQFNSASDHWLDLAVYRAHLEATRRHPHDDPDTCPLCMGRLQQAVALYRGRFLADLRLDDSREYQEWVTVHRERLFREQGEALRRLTGYRRMLGDLERARRYARRWVELDPLSEHAHRQRMEVLALSGRRTAALKQYEVCRRVLGEELGVEPGTETAALYEQIRDGKIRAPADQPPSSALQNLPEQLTPFVGREPELGQVGRLLTRPECRLLTVVGPGGVGKTRLALRAAEQIYGADTFAEGVWFVPLENIASAELLAVTMAEALGLAPEAQQNPKTQLLAHLRPRTMLLVLDNLEHLQHAAAISQPAPPETGPAGSRRAGPEKADALDLLLEILREAPGIKILVTSRERLNCQVEFLVDLEGLPYPAKEGSGTSRTQDIRDLTGLDDAAVRLFVERAGRVRAGFAATTETAPSIIRICQLVEGLPLAIELAAANLAPGAGERPRTCAEVAQAIQEGLDALATSLRDLSPRQRSIRAVLEHSWRLLSAVEKATYRCLSVFRGGFGPEAARAVVGEAAEQAAGTQAAWPPLQVLMDRSLLRRDDLLGGDGIARYNLHLLLRQYAAEKLAEHAEEEASTRERHSRFYLGFLREREEAIAGERGKEALDEIQGEIANVRTAWEWGVAQNAIDVLGQSVRTLASFYNRTGLFQEGETVFRNTAEHLFGASPAPGSLTEVRLLARLRLGQARFLFGLGQFARIPEYTRAAIALAAACRDRTIEAQAELIRGYVHHNQGEVQQARACYERALTLSRTGGSDAGSPASKSQREAEANSLNSLAMVSKRQGRYDEAERYLEQSLQAARQAEDPAGQCRALNGLGTVVSRRGDLSEALDHYRDALRHALACGDRSLEGSLLNNLGNMHLRLGLYEEAGAHYERALEIQRESGARPRQISAWFNQGLIYHYQGDQEIARNCAQQALVIAQEVGDRRAEGFAWLGMGHALMGLGALAEARAAYRQAVNLRRELGQTHLIAEPLAGLARVSQAQGDLGQAQSHVEEILDHLESRGTFDGAISPFQVYLTCTRVLEANQDGRAQELLATAHGLLQEQAAKITGEELRRSFLENVAAHRELVQTHTQLRFAE